MGTKDKSDESSLLFIFAARNRIALIFASPGLPNFKDRLTTVFRDLNDFLITNLNWRTLKIARKRERGSPSCKY